MGKHVYNVDITVLIRELEKASLGEDLRVALVYSLDCVNAIHHRKFWEDEKKTKT